MSACQACGFENPRAWRACARCGISTGQSLRRVEVTSIDPAPLAAAATMVDVQAPTATSVDTLLDVDRSTLMETVDEPSSSYRVEETDPTEQATHSDVEPPLIGQRDASEVIHTGIERAFSLGAPTLVALEGGRGSGKTRLLTHASEFAARLAPDVRVMYASCREDGDSYSPFSRLLLERFDVTPSSSPSAVRGQMSTHVRQVLGTADAIEVGETTHLLGHIAGIPFPDSPFLGPLQSKPAELHQRACKALRKLIECEAHTRPVLVLLDNIHHAGQEAWDMMQAVASGAAHIAIVIAGASPTQERAQQLEPSGGVAAGPIAALSEDEIITMLHVLLPDLVSAPEPLVAAVSHRSSGNPAAIRELVFDLWESGLFVSTAQGLEVDMQRLASNDLPVTMNDAIAARLARLTMFERKTLERAATVGEVFWDGAVLSQMRAEVDRNQDADPLQVWTDDSDAENLGAALDRLQQKGFIELMDHSDLPGSQEFVFPLAGMRRTIYDQIEEPLRIKRHAAVARWLALIAEVRREGVAAMIAPHLERAGQRIRAGRAYIEAAETEVLHLHTGRALKYLAQGLAFVPVDDVVRRIDALHRYGSLLTLVGDNEDAIEAFTEMLVLAWNSGARGKGGAALNRIARVYRQMGEDTRARELLVRALELFRSSGDLRGVASSLDDLAQLDVLQGTVDDGIAAASEALEIRRAHNDSRGEALSLNTIGNLEIRRGQLDTAERMFRQSLEIRQSIGDLEGLLQSNNGLGIVAFHRGERTAAIRAWQNALEQARAIANRRAELFLQNNIGEALLLDGHLDQAAHALAEAQKLVEVLGDKRSAAEVTRNVGILQMRRGDDAAGETLHLALELAEEYGSLDAMGMACRALGQFRAMTLFDESAGGATATQSLQRSIKLFRDSQNERESARSMLALGLHWIEKGRIEDARTILKDARTAMRRLGLPDVAQAERALQNLG